jgi:hypothetical protein
MAVERKDLVMPRHRLTFGNVDIGDELIVAMSYWRKSTRTDSESGGLSPLRPLDDRPLGIVLYPRFKVRKISDDFMAFEQWVFDLATFADGDPRWLTICDAYSSVQVDYGYCKLLSVERPKPADPYAGRWSDQVIVTFQSDTIPRFYS